jgi:hypothetical protein
MVCPEIWGWDRLVDKCSGALEIQRIQGIARRMLHAANFVLRCATYSKSESSGDRPLP